MVGTAREAGAVCEGTRVGRSGRAGLQGTRPRPELAEVRGKQLEPACRERELVRAEAASPAVLDGERAAADLVEIGARLEQPLDHDVVWHVVVPLELEAALAYNCSVRIGR